VNISDELLGRRAREGYCGDCGSGGDDEVKAIAAELLALRAAPPPGPCESWSPAQNPCTLRAGHSGMHEGKSGVAWNDAASAGAPKPLWKRLGGRLSVVQCDYDDPEFPRDVCIAIDTLDERLRKLEEKS